MKLIKLRLRVLTNGIRVGVWGTEWFQPRFKPRPPCNFEMVTKDLLPGGDLAGSKFLDRFTSNDARQLRQSLVQHVLKILFLNTGHGTWLDHGMWFRQAN